MIVQSLRHTGWPVLLALVSVAACSKKAATADTYINASLNPSASGDNLCPVGPGTTVLMVGEMQSSTQPMTVPEGQQGVSVDCTVSPSGDGFDIQLNASQPGTSGGDLVVSGHVNGTTGGQVSAQFVSQTAGSAFLETGDCDLSYTYMGQPIPSGQHISPGAIFAHVSCPKAESQGGSVSGQQITLPDGAVVNAQCDGEADFLFQNCGQ